MAGEILLIAIGLWLIASVIYIVGVLLDKRQLQNIGTGGIAGVIIGLITLIMISIFELTWLGAVVFVISWVILIPLYRSSGMEILYMISIFAIVLGYLFAGPYSGYLKSYTAPLGAPIGMAIDQMWLMSTDLWLMATDPQAYVARQMMSNVRTEKATVDFPKGLEFKKITVLPDAIPSGQEFYLQVYAQNEGEMPAVNAMLSASCASKYCCIGDACDTSEQTTYYYPSKTSPPMRVNQHEVILQRLGPFTTKTYKKNDIGKTADVNVTLHYAHSTSSSLMLTVMDDVEISRIMTDPVQGDELFKTIPAVGKNSPGMIAITVGYQPLFSGSNATLIVSVVNKRPKGNVVLAKDAAMEIKLPAKLGSKLSCKAGGGVSCSGNGQTETCTINTDMPPITPVEKYRAFVCTFIAADNIDTKVTDAITAKLSGYTFEQTEKVGPRMTISFDSSYANTIGGGGGYESEPATGTTAGAGTGTTAGGGQATSAECSQQCKEYKNLDGTNAGYVSGSGTNDAGYCSEGYYPSCSGTTCRHSCTIIANQQGYTSKCYCYKEDSCPTRCEINCIQDRCTDIGKTPAATPENCCGMNGEMVLYNVQTVPAGSGASQYCRIQTSKGCGIDGRNCDSAQCSAGDVCNGATNMCKNTENCEYDPKNILSTSCQPGFMTGGCCVERAVQDGLYGYVTTAYDLSAQASKSGTERRCFVQGVDFYDGKGCKGSDTDCGYTQCDIGKSCDMLSGQPQCR